MCTLTDRLLLLLLLPRPITKTGDGEEELRLLRWWHDHDDEAKWQKQIRGNGRES